MKKDKIILWTATSVFILFMLFSAYRYFASGEIRGAFVHLIFPDYFRVELGVAKLFEALAIFLPFVLRKIKIFVYVGFTINAI